jgi:hypothetical protein
MTKSKEDWVEFLVEAIYQATRSENIKNGKTIVIDYQEWCERKNKGD